MNWLIAAAAWAGEPQDLVFQTAREAEADGRYDDALQACAEAIAGWPGGPRTGTCERRIGFLERRRDQDGTFTAWSALQAVREGFRATEADVRRAEVERITSAPATSAVVRAEGAIWLARDALVNDDPERALRFTAPMVDLPLPDDGPVATQLGQLHAIALARLGRDEEAARSQARVRVAADPAAARPTPVEQIWISRRRRNLAWGSTVAVGMFGLVAAPLAVRALRGGRVVPLGVVPIGVAGLTTAALVYGRAPEVIGSIGGMIAAFVGLHLLSAAALHGTSSTAIRIGVRVLAALATLAAGYLTLWATGNLMWVGG